MANKRGHNASDHGFVETPKVIPAAPTASKIKSKVKQKESLIENKKVEANKYVSQSAILREKNNLLYSHVTEAFHNMAFSSLGTTESIVDLEAFKESLVNKYLSFQKTSDEAFEQFLALTIRELKKHEPSNSEKYEVALTELKRKNLGMLEYYGELFELEDKYMPIEVSNERKMKYSLAGHYAGIDFNHPESTFLGVFSSLEDACNADVEATFDDFVITRVLVN